MEEPKPEPAKQTEPVRSKTVSPTSEPKEQHSRAFSFVSTMFLLAVLAAGVMTYLWYSQKMQNQSLRSDVTSAHSTESSLRTQMDKLKKENTNLRNVVGDQAATGHDATATDKEAMLETAQRYVSAYKDYENSTIEADARNYRSDATFVLVPVVTKNPASNMGCVMKKAHENWVVISCGQGSPDQDTLDRFGVPTDFTNVR